MVKGLCKLVELVRFDKLDEEGKSIGRVIDVNENPRSGEMVGDFYKVDLYRCKKTKKECIAHCDNVCSPFDGDPDEPDTGSSRFSTSNAENCPAYEPIN